MVKLLELYHGGAGRERGMVKKHLRNFNGSQIRDVDWRAGIKMWQQDAQTSGLCGNSSPPLPHTDTHTVKLQIHHTHHCSLFFFWIELLL